MYERYFEHKLNLEFNRPSFFRTMDGFLLE